MFRRKDRSRAVVPPGLSRSAEARGSVLRLQHGEIEYRVGPKFVSLGHLHDSLQIVRLRDDDDRFLDRARCDPHDALQALYGLSKGTESFRDVVEVGPGLQDDDHEWHHADVQHSDFTCAFRLKRELLGALSIE